MVFFPLEELLFILDRNDLTELFFVTGMMVRGIPKWPKIAAVLRLVNYYHSARFILTTGTITFVVVCCCCCCNYCYYCHSYHQL